MQVATIFINSSDVARKLLLAAPPGAKQIGFTSRRSVQAALQQLAGVANVDVAANAGALLERLGGPAAMEPEDVGFQFVQ